MSQDILQIVTQKPVTMFIKNNLADYIDGELITFKYGGMYYSRFVIKETDKEELTSEVYKILLTHIRNQLVKSWIFTREECRSLPLNIKKPIYRDEMGIVTIGV